ncbi:MAG: N-acetylmuramoyl-L-alanine amidase [Deltaproteobacteria bacterium]|nr:N-acetylmuramoyl-L-alanine amidase [Deltaproteobacteria bacterium]
MTPRLKYLFIPFLAAAILALWFQPSEAASNEVLFKYAEQAKTWLDKIKKAHAFRHNWLNVTDRYKRVLKKNPTNRRARQSLLTIGDLYLGLYKRSRLTLDLNKALDYYRRLTKRFPKDPLAAEAQVKIGQVYYLYKQDKDRAYVEFLKVELNHPESPQVAEAQKWMTKISGMPVPKVAASKPPVSTGLKPMVKGVRHWSTPSYTRVVIDLDRETKFKDHLLRPDLKQHKPMRLYMDLTPSRIDPNIKEVLPIANRLLQRVRIAQHDLKTVRVVLDIANIETYRIFALSNPFRIVIDVTGRPLEQAVAAAKPKPATQAKPEAPKPAAPLTDLKEAAEKRKKVPRGLARKYPSQASLARQLRLGVRKIVIDPGHGGKDRGATGVTGLIEKDLTLRISKLLAKKIEKQLGIKCILTRTKDVFLPLEERTAIANTVGADLFISVHANAHKDKRIHGIETYFLNLATDEEAMRVAARENATSTKTMSDLELILNDLMLNSKITESSHLAKAVQTQMVKCLCNKYKNVKDMGVKQAPFYVLIGANMPSILLEMAFISNKNDEARMREKRYLENMANGIVEGIKNYTKSVKKAELI